MIGTPKRSIPHTVSLADVGRKTVVATVAGLAFIPARTGQSRNSFQDRMKRSALVRMTPGAAEGKEILRDAPSFDRLFLPIRRNCLSQLIHVNEGLSRKNG